MSIFIEVIAPEAIVLHPRHNELCGAQSTKLPENFCTSNFGGMTFIVSHDVQYLSEWPRFTNCTQTAVLVNKVKKMLIVDR